jgi:CheY-like chemotaxis protein
VLEPAGYPLAVAGSLAEARAWLATQQPDLLLLDVGLPDGSGLELLGELRASPIFGGLPVLVASVRVLEADKESARRAGSSACLEKPLLPRVLLDAVSSALR